MKFNNVRLLVKDYTKCFKFYTEKMGLEPAWGDEKSGYASFKVADGIEGLAIFVSDWMAETIGNIDKQIPVECREKMMVVLNVDNVDKEYQRLKERGIQFFNEPHDMPGWGARVVHFYDPENNLIELFTPLSKENWSEDLMQEDKKF